MTNDDKSIFSGWYEDDYCRIEHKGSNVYALYVVRYSDFAGAAFVYYAQVLAEDFVDARQKLDDMLEQEGDSSDD